MAEGKESCSWLPPVSGHARKANFYVAVFAPEASALYLQKYTESAFSALLSYGTPNSTWNKKIVKKFETFTLEH